jgi:excisionase family DNA binding protein
METGHAAGRNRRGTVSVQEAADLLGVVRRTVHRWHSLGRMPPRVPNGRRLQYRRVDILALANGDMTRDGGQSHR